ncbi:MAG: greA [Candidatus Saccharibacteria bacterium]|jgi:transcription elongation factor GreA|nr:greA [Candidatus Saccharibacteria bacterium]
MKKMYQITDEGKRELEAELAELVGRRGAIADKIAEARDFGDLSENAEYDSAREEQGLVESRVAEIEDILLNAELIKAAKSSKVILGSKVELQSGKKTTTYSVVGPVEANPLEGKISNESPLGEALMGKKVGDSATISTQKGEISYKIVNIG